STTALAGPIGFIGLMIPHFVRRITGPDMRRVLPLSALGGAGLLVFADVLGRVLGAPSELEVGIVTALLGAPVFVFIVRKVKVSAL
ncbi:MAG: iron chelate uptake ABC transporter family permease subunit, partial [Lachnospiraceae bacterium]|nr:iron chelate uptake ABC transporter family permease subunit [Lachnospiraceae bacterium]